MLSIFETVQNILFPNRIIEYVEEMASIAFDDRQNILIQVNPDEGRQGLEYFKFYDSTVWKKANKFARIEFRRPKYVIHGNMHGKERWFLNNREKKDLIDLLNSRDSDSKLTVWQQAIIQFNMEKGLNYNQTKENLLCDKQLKYPNYLPFDLPMPDYMKLKK